MAFVTSHVLPQPPQLFVDVVLVSHPFTFVPEVSQSRKPLAHPEYVHFPAVQAAPTLFTESHLAPHAPQLTSETAVSQPLRSAPA